MWLQNKFLQNFTGMDFRNFYYNRVYKICYVDFNNWYIIVEW